MHSVGDSKTMATHPWSSTHVIMSEEDRLRAGITEDLIRLSVGTEDISDIIGDLEQALDQIPEKLLGSVSKPKTNGIHKPITNGISEPKTNGI